MKYAVLLLCLVGTAAALVSTSPRSEECKAAGVYTRYVFVQSVPQLQAAVANAKPGDLIELRPRNYTTTFTIQKSGTGVQPIKICGPPTARIQGDFRFPAITIRNSQYIALSGFTVSRSLYGVLVENSSPVQLKKLVIQRIGYQGVVLRSSDSALVQGTQLTRVGIKDNTKGQGIWVDNSKGVQIISNNVFVRPVTGSLVLVTKGSDGGAILSNIFGGWDLKGSIGADNWVDIQANGFTVANNTGFASPNDGFKSSGSNNVFVENKCYLSWNSKGVCIKVACDAACQSTNKVDCSNTVIPSASSPNQKQLTNLKVTC